MESTDTKTQHCLLEGLNFQPYGNDMIYLSTAIGWMPGGSSTVHIYTQTTHRTAQLTKQYKQKTKQHKQQIWKSAGRAQSLQVIPWHLSYN
jgi:hypothetical protein